MHAPEVLPLEIDVLMHRMSRMDRLYDFLGQEITNCAVDTTVPPFLRTFVVPPFIHGSFSSAGVIAAALTSLAHITNSIILENYPTLFGIPDSHAWDKEFWNELFNLVLDEARQRYGEDFEPLPEDTEGKDEWASEVRELLCDPRYRLTLNFKSVEARENLVALR